MYSPFQNRLWRCEYRHREAVEKTDRLQKVDRCRLCHLDGQAGCRQVSSGEFLENPIREIWRIDRRGAKVDPHGMSIPTIAQRTCASSASPRTQSVSRPINPVFSARGTNRVGDTLPWTGLAQRRRASTDARRAVAGRDLRLVSEGQFAAVDGKAQICQEPEVCCGHRAEVAVPERLGLTLDRGAACTQRRSRTSSGTSVPSQGAKAKPT